MRYGKLINLGKENKTLECLTHPTELKQDLRNCHNRSLVRDVTSLIATFKYSHNVTHPTEKICQLRKSYENYGINPSC